MTWLSFCEISRFPDEEYLATAFQEGPKVLSQNSQLISVLPHRR